MSVAELNDNLRRNILNPNGFGKVFLAGSVSALPDYAQFVLLVLIRNFKDFNSDNDPCGEHDFGKVRYMDDDYFFKIDYYNENMTGGSKNPSDAKQTTRVITIMRADEY